MIAWFYVRHIDENHQAIVHQTAEKERLEVAQNLAGGMAHLVNNEMQGVIGTVELLKLDNDDQAVAGDLDRIHKLSTQASSHADQLLAYARGGKYAMQSMDLKMILSTLLKPWKSDLPNHTQLKVHWPATEAKCVGNPAQLGQILMVMLENAKEAIEDSMNGQYKIDHHAAGLIAVSFQEDAVDKHCKTRGLSPGRYIRVSVEDNGCGMDQYTCNRIFEPFYSTRFSGRGMGLAAAYGIIKNHGGHISVNSQEGNGSQFHVWLPAEPTD